MVIIVTMTAKVLYPLRKYGFEPKQRCLSKPNQVVVVPEPLYHITELICFSVLTVICNGFGRHRHSASEQKMTDKSAFMHRMEKIFKSVVEELKVCWEML